LRRSSSVLSGTAALRDFRFPPTVLILADDAFKGTAILTIDLSVVVRAIRGFCDSVLAARLRARQEGTSSWTMRSRRTSSAGPRAPREAPRSGSPTAPEC
jgi:hypothetical protein